MHPILLRLPTPWGEFPVYSYGVLLGTSLTLAWYFVVWWGEKKERIDADLLGDAFLAGTAAALFGARLLYVLTNLRHFPTFGSMLAFREGGMVAYGGFLGGFLGVWGYLRWKRVPLAPVADVIAPTLASGLLLTRIGCYLYGCDYGRPLGEHAPGWLRDAGTFPRWAPEGTGASAQIHGSPAYLHHLEAYADRIDPSATASLPVHPTQLYESLAGLVLLIIALVVLRHRRFPGQVFLVVSLLYAVVRFGLELLRDDPERGSLAGLSTSQLVSLAIVPAVIGTWLVWKRMAAEGALEVPAAWRAKVTAAESEAA